MKDPVFAAFITKLSNPANVQSIQILQAANALPVSITATIPNPFYIAGG